MTDERSTPGDSSVAREDSTADAARTATLRTTLADAEVVAAAVRPDNTPEIDTRVERDADGTALDGDDVGTVVTTVERETTGGLRTTVDDYVVNLAVARDVVQFAERHADATEDADTTRDADGARAASADEADTDDADVTSADDADTHHTQP